MRGASLAAGAGALLALAGPCDATQIEHLAWVQLVEGADLVGVVECEVAGGIVARYRVVESWKGPPAGTRVAIAQEVSYWGPQYPLALVEERSVVTAFRGRPPLELVSSAAGGSVPLWWRGLPADYRIPLGQGRVELPLDERDATPLGGVGSPHPDLASFRAAVRSFLARDAPGREAMRLAALFHEGLTWPSLGPAAAEEWSELGRELDSARTGRDAALVYLRLARRFGVHERGPVFAVLAEGGGEQTRDLLLELEAAGEFPGTSAELGSLVRSLAERLEPRPPEAPAHGAGEGEDGFVRAARDHPAETAEWLVAWRNEPESWMEEDRPWVLGSWFGWRSGGERRKNLLRLLEAREPFVRVAAAVYLAFEDEPAARARLRELQSLPGDPGAWAALTLARRGDAAAMPRALEVFAHEVWRPDGELARPFVIVHDVLQRRLLELLSNSAAAAGVEPPWPPPPVCEAMDDSGRRRWTARHEREAAHEHLTRWWLRNRARIALHDPWLPQLAARRID